MINLNATLVVQVILFLITLFFLNRLLIRPIMKVVQNRTRFFQETEDKILSLEKETEELVGKGIPAIYYAKGQFAYFDTRKVGNVILELMQRRDMERKE